MSDMSGNDYQHPDYLHGCIHALEVVAHATIRGKIAAIPAADAIADLKLSFDKTRPGAGNILFHSGFTDTLKFVTQD